jgi:beta-1,4-mannooligosaccharide/beta-1,4-mannosyl-N-acetylglucosamine phosphorylase
MVHYPETGRVRVYYGCADTCVSAAEADLDELIAFIKQHRIQ